MEPCWTVGRSEWIMPKSDRREVVEAVGVAVTVVEAVDAAATVNGSISHYLS